MNANFTIEVDQARRLLRTHMTGLLSLDDVDAFVAHRRAALRKLGCDGHGHVTLNDIRECNILPQQVLGAFQVLANSPEQRARKVAFLTNSALARLQTRRMVSDDRVRWFVSEDAALAWLMTPEKEEAASAAERTSSARSAA